MSLIRIMMLRASRYRTMTKSILTTAKWFTVKKSRNKKPQLMTNRLLFLSPMRTMVRWRNKKKPIKNIKLKSKIRKNITLENMKRRSSPTCTTPTVRRT